MRHAKARRAVAAIPLRRSACPPWLAARSTRFVRSALRGVLPRSTPRSRAWLAVVPLIVAAGYVGVAGHAEFHFTSRFPNRLSGLSSQERQLAARAQRRSLGHVAQTQLAARRTHTHPAPPIALAIPLRVTIPRCLAVSRTVFPRHFRFAQTHTHARLRLSRICRTPSVGSAQYAHVGEGRALMCRPWRRGGLGPRARLAASSRTLPRGGGRGIVPPTRARHRSESRDDRDAGPRHR